MVLMFLPLVGAGRGNNISIYLIDSSRLAGPDLVQFVSFNEYLVAREEGGLGPPRQSATHQT